MFVNIYALDRDSISSTDWQYDFNEEDGVFELVYCSHSGTTKGCFWTEDKSFEGQCFSFTEIVKLIEESLKDSTVYVNDEEVTSENLNDFRSMYEI